MYSDRELLELAAKAAGVPAYWSADGTLQARPIFVVSAGGRNGTMPFEEEWNPLKNDCDALRLAVKLRIDASHDEIGMKSFVYVRTAFNDERYIGLSEIFDDESERLDRTRRAIVRAAAAIGEGMQ